MDDFVYWILIALIIFLFFYFVLFRLWRLAKPAKTTASISTCPAWYCTGLRQACEQGNSEGQAYAQKHAVTAEQRIMSQQPGWECGNAVRHCERCMLKK